MGGQNTHWRAERVFHNSGHHCTTPRTAIFSYTVTDDLQHRLQTALGDGYLIERELGGAGMSRVFVATEQALQRRVVVKVLPPDLAAGVNHERFRREIQVAAQLQHPHIVPLLAAGESGGLLWFTMPFIEGESLRAAIARRGRFPARDVVRVLHDVTDALAYAHARGVVHRDIKPGNILTSGMHALVTDFGVAKALSASTPTASGGTTTGMAIGTPAYMAPEQLAADPAADHRMDIYAVGLLGYELLTGKSPFSGTSPQATLAAQLTLTPEAPARSLPDVPEGLSNIIMQCLEKDANKRPASATALLAELDALPMIGSGETPSRTVRGSRKGPLILASVVVLAALALVTAQRSGLMGGAGQPDTTTTKSRATRAGSAKRAGASGGATIVAGATGDTSSSGVAARHDTVIVYRDTSLSDAEKRLTMPMVISRAESISIATHFRERNAPTAPAEKSAAAVAPATGTRGLTTSDGKVLTLNKTIDNLAPIARESLYAEVARVFSDSLKLALKQLQVEFAQIPRAAMRGAMDVSGNISAFVPPIVAPPAEGTTRIVVQPFTINGGPPPSMSGADEQASGPPSSSSSRREMMRLGRLFADSLRAALVSHPNLNVVDSDLTMRAQATVNATGNRNATGNNSFVSVGWSLRADYIVTGSVITRRDSIMVFTQFNALRGGFSRSLMTTVPVNDPFRGLPESVASVNMWIDSARVTRRTDRGEGRGAGRGGPSDRPTDSRFYEGPRSPKTPPPPAENKN